MNAGAVVRGLAKAVLLVVLLSPAMGFADDGASDHGRHRGHGWGRGHGHGNGDSHGVPEFDPTAAGSAGALLAGGSLLVARRRSRKP